MNETLRVEIEIETDISNVKGVLSKIREKLVEIKAVKGITCVAAKQFNKNRGIWLTYGWGIGKGSSQIWVPLKQEAKGQRPKAKGIVKEFERKHEALLQLRDTLTKFLKDIEEEVDYSTEEYKNLEEEMK